MTPPDTVMRGPRVGSASLTIPSSLVAEVAGSDGGGRLGVEHVEDVGCAVGRHGGGEPTVVSLLTAGLNAPTTVFVFVVQPPVLTNGTAWS